MAWLAQQTHFSGEIIQICMISFDWRHLTLPFQPILFPYLSSLYYRMIVELVSEVYFKIHE